MKVCVTGAIGKAGRAVVAELREHGHEVIATDLVAPAVGRPHWLHWTLSIASPGLPSIGHAVRPGRNPAWLLCGVNSGNGVKATRGTA